MLRLLPLLAVFALATPVCAQSTPSSLDAPASSVDRPDRPLVMMNLAGHPDDEDAQTMAYYRGNQDAVVYSVIYTRGEGGQNEIGRTSTSASAPSARRRPRLQPASTALA